MRTSLVSYVAAFALGILIQNADGQIDWPDLSYTPIATGAEFPVHVTHSGDGTGRLFVVEQGGRIRIMTTNGLAPTPFLDIRDRVSFQLGIEDGLLGLAFPTNFQASGQFYTYYVRTGDLASVVSRFTVSPTNMNQVDSATEQPILVIPEVTERTLNGGMVIFGPDGYLYVSTGDNGFDYSVDSLAQNRTSLWGKILRLDISGSFAGYSVPPSNPFVGKVGYAPEIWALGLRNPWRLSFDRANGDLYFSDVGQFIAEEIDYEPVTNRGGHNYGWQPREGFHDFFSQPGATPSFTDPILEVLHGPFSQPQSITGGCVYRGPNQPRMNGMYFFGDAYSGLIKGLIRSNGIWQTASVLQTPFILTSFGEDEAGNLYVTDYISGGVYQLKDSGKALQPTFSPQGPESETDVITVNSLTSGFVIRYTTDGTDPTGSSLLLGTNNRVTITSGITLKARASRSNELASAVTTQTYSLKAAKPSFSPAMGPITNGTPVTITSRTADALIRYTINGTDPDATAPLYSGPVRLQSADTIKARAFRTGFTASEVAAFHSASLTVQLNSIVFLSPASSSGRYVLSWPSIPGQSYKVQYSSDFTYWAEASSNLVASGPFISFTNATLLQNPRRGYFRVLAQ